MRTPSSLAGQVAARSGCVRALGGACLAAQPALAAAAPFELTLSPLTLGLLAAMGVVGIAIATLALWRDRRPASDAQPLATDPEGDKHEAARLRHFVGSLPGGSDSVPPAFAPAAMPAVVRTRGHGIAIQATMPMPLSPSVAQTAASAPAPAAPPRNSMDTPAALPARTAHAAAQPEAIAAIGPASLIRDVPLPAFAVAPEPASDEPSAFLALQHVDLAIDVLHRHLAATERPMPAVWVMLLDLCRTHGREEAFRTLAAEFHDRFNVCVAAWETYPPERTEAGLEAHPRILRALTQTWGTHECRRLLDRLLYDTRHSERRGFTLTAYNDLIALRRAADVVLTRIEQAWSEEAMRDAMAPAPPNSDLQDPAYAAVLTASPHARELEEALDADVRELVDARSALAREHPAFAEVLASEWGNAALASRLCDMLARGGDGAKPISAEAREELERLQAIARRAIAADALSRVV